MKLTHTTILLVNYVNERIYKFIRSSFTQSLDIQSLFVVFIYETVLNFINCNTCVIMCLNFYQYLNVNMYMYMDYPLLSNGFMFCYGPVVLENLPAQAKNYRRQADGPVVLLFSA